MKYIVKFLCVFMVLSITGCASIQYDLPYKCQNIESDFIDSSEKAIPFAYSSCITDNDVLDVTGIDMNEIGAAGLFDLSKKEVLYAKNPHTQLDPASLTKVMTAIVALKYSSLDTIITVDEPIVFNEVGATSINLKVGDKLTLDQALHILLLRSANDVAIAIAREIGGSEEAFCELMNKEALSLGATNTHFLNSHGLTTDNHYTCIYDMYLIFQEAINYSKFNDIIQLDSYTTKIIDVNAIEKEINCTNSNRFIASDELILPDNISVLGGKTGTTNRAGHCLIIHSKDTQNNSYISVILNAPNRDMIYSKMIELLSLIGI